MKTIISCSLAIICIVLLKDATGRTTHHPHTHRPHIGGSVAFFYDASSHYMIMKKAGYCYFMGLSSAQEQDVHNPDGIRAIETSMLNVYTTASHFGMTGTDHANISNYVYRHFCNNEHLIKLVE